jgi:hypothetical protein
LDKGGYIGYCIHSNVDVLLCGLGSSAAAEDFKIVAQRWNAQDIIDDAGTMIRIIHRKAKEDAKTFTHVDLYTTRCGYSTGQICHLPRNLNSLQRSIARGGPAQQAFLKPPGRVGEINIITSRVSMRMQMVNASVSMSKDFVTWQKGRRPQVTYNFRWKNKFVWCPFTVDASLPEKSDGDQIKLASWESSICRIEEHLMTCVFGMLSNVIWASILARVLERAVKK